MSQVPQEVRQARRDELVSLQQDIGQDFASSLVGREVCPDEVHNFSMVDPKLSEP